MDVAVTHIWKAAAHEEGGLIRTCLRWLRASVVLVFVATAFAQQPAEVSIEKEPHHHMVFENEYVRVFKVEVAPHEATLVHRHTRDYVVVMIGDAEVTNAVVGKEPKKWSFKDGDVTFLEANGEKSFAHKAVNEGEKPFVNYTIELKQSTHAKRPELGIVGETYICSGICFRTIVIGDEYQCTILYSPDSYHRVLVAGNPHLVMMIEEPKANAGERLLWIRATEKKEFKTRILDCGFKPITH